MTRTLITKSQSMVVSLKRDTADWELLISINATESWRLLSPVQQDIVSLFGIAFGIASVIGLIVAIAQIMKTRNAAKAATKATDDVVDAFRNSISGHSAVLAKRYMSEVNGYAASENWLMAALRAGDTADKIAEIEYSYPSVSLEEVINGLRGWQQTFYGIETGKHKWTKSLVTKWAESSTKYSRALDNYSSIEQSAKGTVDRA